jgi:hypothetical protein
LLALQVKLNKVDEHALQIGVQLWGRREVLDVVGVTTVATPICLLGCGHGGAPFQMRELCLRQQMYTCLR